MKRIAIYPGSFDPLTLGHMDIIERALPLFDEIFVCISMSSQKKYLFTLEERRQMIQEAFTGNTKLKMLVNPGLTAEAATSIGATFILRGIRTYLDVEYEKSMDVMNKTLQPKLETVLLFASPNLISVSSSLVKEVAALKGDVSAFVPKNVLSALQKKWS